MFRIYENREGVRQLIGGVTSLEAAQSMVMRAAGEPMVSGAALGSYRGPNEFLPRGLGTSRFEIVEQEPRRAGWFVAA